MSQQDFDSEYDAFGLAFQQQRYAEGKLKTSKDFLNQFFRVSKGASISQSVAKQLHAMGGINFKLLSDLNQFFSLSFYLSLTQKMNWPNS